MKRSLMTCDFHTAVTKPDKVSFVLILNLRKQKLDFPIPYRPWRAMTESVLQVLL